MSSDFFGAGLVRFLFSFVFYYPFLMAFVWMCGGLAHAFFFERDRHLPKDPLSMLDATPMVSVIVPCYNEGRSVTDVIDQLMRSRYPNFEVLAVNDGSTDDTVHNSTHSLRAIPDCAFFTMPSTRARRSV